VTVESRRAESAAAVDPTVRPNRALRYDRADAFGAEFGVDPYLSMAALRFVSGVVRPVADDRQ
jgi:hypothetical protein